MADGAGGAAQAWAAIGAQQALAAHLAASPAAAAAAGATGAGEGGSGGPFIPWDAPETASTAAAVAVAAAATGVQDEAISTFLAGLQWSAVEQVAHGSQLAEEAALASALGKGLPPPASLAYRGVMHPKGSKPSPEGSPDSGKIFCGGLPRNATEAKVVEWASKWGTVTKIEMKYDVDGSFRGFCFVSFAEQGAVRHAISASKAQRSTLEAQSGLFEGKWIDIKEAVQKEGKKSGKEQGEGFKGEGKPWKGKGPPTSFGAEPPLGKTGKGKCKGKDHGASFWPSAVSGTKRTFDEMSIAGAAMWGSNGVADAAVDDSEAKWDLVRRVESMQESSLQAKRGWIDFCGAYGQGSFEPGRHTADFLRRFLDSVVF